MRPAFAPLVPESLDHVLTMAFAKRAWKEAQHGRKKSFGSAQWKVVFRSSPGPGGHRLGSLSRDPGRASSRSANPAILDRRRVSSVATCRPSVVIR